MSHITLCIVLMLLFLPHSAQAEKYVERIDPFRSLAAVRCSPTATLPQGQLKGVIGSGARWIGWFAQPEAGWIRLTSGETIPPGNWLVSELDKSGAKLVPTEREAGCDGLPEKLLLASPFIKRPAE
ncbi:DUF2531 domain-containing protein [Pectobacterium zantedeschiae]|uniref:DUF2531 domain-containing protein n=1 Tax=Pectobacterium zantedeschiae TaxID=2034769 RepID=A0A9X8P3P4_9GAMM|nr:DUF2531 domain-containing protein [Pectobacterium zantedeschiae]RYC39974.1 DUF2531 domain-containing protein [Pectobacterium zantedeschiae]